MSDKQKFAFDRDGDCHYRISIDDGTYVVRNGFRTGYFQCTQNQGSTCCLPVWLYIDDIRSVA